MNSFRTKQQAQLTPKEKSIADYLNSIGVGYYANWCGHTRHHDWECDAWIVVFAREAGRENCTFKTDYFTGLGHRVAEEPVPDIVRKRPKSIAAAEWIARHVKPHRPEVGWVLYSILQDSETAANTTFKDWCCDYGYDTDSRKALDTYLECQSIGVELRNFFTADERESLSILLKDY